ncbi:MAG TPA: phytanoyl-CoA dioxygenase family protein [Myxococcales bacterium]|jgi:phytanoyl-CoA hydroxylase|nr:phytanoyl-CoA dioxygenase family protein [Myxococcales bacterium]HIL81530.1 phytanoyl-CoA dioxygenase family protein [Myxococcales bacterium]
MKDEYFEKGYIVRRGLIPAHLITELNQRFVDVAEGHVAPAENMQVVRNVEIAKGLVTPKTTAHGISKMNFIQADPVLRQFSNYGPLLDQVTELIGPDLISMNSMYLNKPPHVDGRHPLHQDLIYFPFRPADQIVGVWTALDRTTRENGCLVMIPESHKGEIHPHDYPDWEHKNHLFIGVKDVDPSGRVHLEMEPGDTAFFHSKIIHGSGFNRTEGMRRAIAVHFANSRCEDVWAGHHHKLDKYSPRDDYRLVRGEDPNDYVAIR